MKSLKKLIYCLFLFKLLSLTFVTASQDELASVDFYSPKVLIRGLDNIPLMRFNLWMSSGNEALGEFKADVNLSFSSATSQLENAKLIHVDSTQVLASGGSASGNIISANVIFTGLNFPLSTGNNVFELQVDSTFSALAPILSVDIDSADLLLVGGNHISGNTITTGNVYLSPARSQLSIGDTHLCFIHNSELYSAGNNSFGQMGIGVTSSTTALQVGSASDWRQVSSGAFHNLALNSSGNLFAWGHNSYGQVGNGSSGNVGSLYGITGIGNVVRIETGAYTSYALNDSGQLYAWGRNEFGQLGDGTTIDRMSPVLVNLPSVGPIEDFSAGSDHFLLKSGGNLFAYGSNGFGQAALSNQILYSTVASPVVFNGNIIQLSAGGFHSLALLENGDVKAWGRNDYGQLGSSNLQNQYMPVSANIINITAIDAGYLHSLYYESGKIHSSGDHRVGQLGQGSSIGLMNPMPTQVGVSNAYSDFAAGSYASMSSSSIFIELWGKLIQTNDVPNLFWQIQSPR